MCVGREYTKANVLSSEFNKIAYVTCDFIFDGHE